jgi:hypothetical protein
MSLPLPASTHSILQIIHILSPQKRLRRYLSKSHTSRMLQLFCRTSQSRRNMICESFHFLPIDDAEINRYETTKRLATDKNPENTFRHSTYISVTGGGGGATASLAFLTDSRENRAQRAACGDLMRRLGLLTSKDCVLSMHPSGNLYRYVNSRRLGKC